MAPLHTAIRDALTCGPMLEVELRAFLARSGVVATKDEVRLALVELGILLDDCGRWNLDVKPRRAVTPPRQLPLKPWPAVHSGPPDPDNDDVEVYDPHLADFDRRVREQHHESPRESARREA